LAQQRLAFDPRVIIVSVEINGKISHYQDLNIHARGTKYANANQNECEVRIFNLTKETRDFLMTKTSPFNLDKTPKRVTIVAGRQSYGTTTVFVGDVISAISTQPPDIMITLKCLTGNFQKGKVISRSQPAQASLFDIAKQVASDLDTGLIFQTENKNISNYTFTGGALKQVNDLNAAGPIEAYVDDGNLIVKDVKTPLKNRVSVVNESTGMIGVPELTEQGVKVKFLLNGQTTLGGLVRVVSKLNSAANGDYVIYKLSFDVATREEPFYWIAEGMRV
jgi:hypothetical protein